MIKSVKKPKVKIKLLMAFLLIFCISVLSGPVVKAADDYSINVSAELDNSQKFYVFTVKVKNKGKAFDGSVRLSCDTFNGDLVGHEIDISIPAESESSFEINVPSDNMNPTTVVYVRLFDDDGDKVYQEKFKDVIAENQNGDYYDPSRHDINSGNIKEVHGYMEEPVTGTSGIVSLVVIIYVVLVGPLIYLILKSINKREIIWLVIPGISLTFVFIMFLIGLSVRVNKPSIRSVELIDGAYNTDKTYIFGYSPESDEWTIKAKENYLFGDSTHSYSYDNSSNREKYVIKSDTSGDELTTVPSGAFDYACFIMSKDKKVTDPFIIDDSYQNSFSPIIKNNSGQDLDYVFIHWDDGYVCYKDVKNGEEMDMMDDNTKWKAASTGVNYNLYSVNKALVREEYEEEDYEDASELAALAMAVEATADEYMTIKVVGVKKGSSKTVLNEDSYMCYYSCSRREY